MQTGRHNNVDNKYIDSIVIGLIGGCANALLGGFTIPLQILLILMIMDYVTGIIKGYYKKELSSSTGFLGILKKFGILFVVILAYQLGVLTNQPVVKDMACIFYIVNEGLSILENLAAIGVPIPGFLKDKLKGLNENKDDEKDEK